jgi:hypothetical protein
MDGRFWEIGVVAGSEQAARLKIAAAVRRLKVLIVVLGVGSAVHDSLSEGGWV